MNKKQNKKLKNILITNTIFTFSALLMYQKINKKLTNENILLKRKVETDQLTSLLNRHGIEDRINSILNLKKNIKSGFGFILIDIDFFKAYNDVFGHQEGDMCLKKVAASILKSVKDKTDFVARYGGEEFLVVLQDINDNQIIDIAKRIRKNVEELKIPAGKTDVSKYLTVSLGISLCRNKNTFDYYKLLKKADKQLYLVKSNKRNAIGFNNKIYK